MRTYILFVLLFASGTTFAQPANEVISEANVTRIIRTLAADAMMGRPAASPELIEPAAAFIESEFERAGLMPLPGQVGFRQPFTKQRVSPGQSAVSVDGREMANGSYLIVSDLPSIDERALNVKLIPYDSTVADLQQHFFAHAGRYLRDTASFAVIFDKAFAGAFQTFRQYFGERFTSGRNNVKVFIMGLNEGKSVSVKATQEVGDITMANVAGMLEGKSRKDEFVIFSAHYDHIGVRPPVNGDSIANGADDDASGTTAVMVLAEHFRKMNNNARSIIFVAFTAEEIGGFGSKYFSKQLDPENIVAMFNIEMIGKPSKWGRDHAFMTGYERSDLGEIVARNLEGSDFHIMPDPYPKQNLFYRSDNATLARLGVPAHTVSTDQIDTDEFYHTVDDEFETLDVPNIVAAIRAIYLGSRSVVAGQDTPSRIDKSTVR